MDSGSRACGAAGRGSSRYLLNGVSLREGFEITDDLGGNIFPSATCRWTTDAQ